MSEGTDRLRNHKRTGFRLLAVLLAVALMLSVMGRIAIDPTDYDSGASAAAAGYLYDENRYIDQNSLLRGGEAAMSALSSPRTFDDYYQVAEIAVARGQYPEAIEAILSCLSLSDQQDKVLLAGLQLKLGCLQTLTGDDIQALSSLSTAVQLDSNLADAWLVQTEIYIGHQNWLAAARSLDTYLELKPEDTRMLAAMGEILEMSGDLIGAIDQYTLSLQFHHAADPNVFLRRGSCLMQIGNYEGAASDLSQAIQNGAEPAMATESLAMAYLLLEDYDAVLQAGKNLADTDQASPGLLQHMGVAALAVEQVQAADGYFSRSIQLDDTLPANYYYRGVCRLTLEQYSDASADFTVSIERGEMLQLCHYNRGVCAIKLEDFDAAKADMNQTLALSDDASLSQAAKGLLKQLAQS